MANILGVRIDSFSKKEALEKARDFLDEGQHTIFTPNPEMLVDATQDEQFRQILNMGSLNICDGSGIRFVSNGTIPRIPGVDFMLDLCKLAAQKKKRVYLLGAGKTDGAEAAAVKLKEQFPHLNIVGFHSGPRIISAKEGALTFEHKKENAIALEDIQRTAPDILFVAFGHKKQEVWIAAFLESLPSVRIAMGVGGAFDFIAGTKKRAPAWMRAMWLEWLYRLIQEPTRIKRIWKATVGFLYRYYRYQYTYDDTST